MSVICTNCEHVFKDHTNLFGKVCMQCGHFMPPVKELPIVRENRRKFALLLKEARDLIASKRGTNANNHR